MSEFERQERFLRWGVGVGLGTAVLLILLIAAGLFDPKPVGPFQPAINLTLAVPAQGQAVHWLDTSLPPGDFSVRLDMTFAEKGTDEVAGLLLGSEAAPLWVGVSPLGYVEVMDGETAVMPLQTWVHVRPSTNEIWVDMRSEIMTIRINRELLWRGMIVLSGRRVGIAAEGEEGVVNGQLSIANGQ